ncbi:hypothetical protein [Deinococcus maricopensis]|uniref:Uncharacterized protein n=1 Tax=Deinococcus maricopensis (strain DSM 21211 / LMG 22137 / NRRL B-23946 / LB-34) TaxID=709986 RepID=E8U4G9_DEIML|nr:hypothetical protein [Deinococcus maricopensis]ADV68834.1 hypothetical protein Deima_3207 [Deinococcus maricopensis DSM 21211]
MFGLFKRKKEEPLASEHPVFETGVAALEYYLTHEQIPYTQAAGTFQFEVDGRAYEGFTVRAPEWLCLRTTLPFTSDDELVIHETVSELCTRNTLFRVSIDWTRRVYVVDALLYLKFQRDQHQTIGYVFYLAQGLDISKEFHEYTSDYFVYCDGKKNIIVALSMAGWLRSKTAPPGTTVDSSTYAETAYRMGGALCSVSHRDKSMIGAYRFATDDYQEHWRKSREAKLDVYRQIDRERVHTPLARNFIYAENGGRELSMPVVVAKGSEARPIYEAVLEEALEQFALSLDYFHGQFNAPWFDHTKKRRE